MCRQEKQTCAPPTRGAVVKFTTIPEQQHAREALNGIDAYTLPLGCNRAVVIITRHRIRHHIYTAAHLAPPPRLRGGHCCYSSIHTPTQRPHFSRLYTGSMFFPTTHCIPVRVNPTPHSPLNQPNSHALAKVKNHTYDASIAHLHVDAI